jgi:hypothetical protein
MEKLETKRESLVARDAELGVNIASIKSQLEHAQARRETGRQMADPIWVARANSALRHYKREREAAQNELSRVNRVIKAARAQASDRRFIDVARRVLDKETYCSILSQVSAA